MSIDPIYHLIFSKKPLAGVEVITSCGLNTVPIIHSLSCTEYPWRWAFNRLSFRKYQGPSRTKYANYVDLMSLPFDVVDAITGVKEWVEHSQIPPYPVVRRGRLEIPTSDL